MQIIRNERRINVLSSVGQYASLGGLVILLAGLVISFVRPTWMVPLIVSISVGFILSVIGGFFADRYAGSLAHHKALAEVLKGLDYRHTLIQYLLPADHVLLEPGGCTCFVVKAQGGRIAYDREKDNWSHEQRGKFFRRLVGQEGVGSPAEEARQEKERLEQYLKAHMEDSTQIPVRGVVVFVNEDVQVNADQAPVPTFYRRKVKDWLRGLGALAPLPGHVQQQLAATLGVTEAEGK